jgi:hypothetical protein
MLRVVVEDASPVVPEMLTPDDIGAAQPQKIVAHQLRPAREDEMGEDGDQAGSFCLRRRVQTPARTHGPICY